ncbi:DoxX family protein [Nocardia sp. NPDC003693]
MIAAPRLGVAAGVGRTAFFVGAIAVHVHTRVFHNIAFPGLFLLLAAASTIYMVQLAAA